MFDNNETSKNYTQGANRSSVKLYERLESLTAEWDKRIYDSKNIDDKWFARRGKEQALANTIATTPIPISIEDLFEFLAMAQAAALNPSTPYYSADAYMSKYNEAIIKAKLLFHKKFTKFTKFTHFRVRVWRFTAFHLRFARSNGRRRRIIVSTYAEKTGK